MTDYTKSRSGLRDTYTSPNDIIGKAKTVGDFKVSVRRFLKDGRPNRNDDVTLGFKLWDIILDTTVSGGDIYYCTSNDEGNAVWKNISSSTGNPHASTHDPSGSDPIPIAIANTAPGLMSGTDKAKLDGIAPNANNYSLEVHGDAHHTESYLKSETDPVFSSSAAAGISTQDIINWNTVASGQDLSSLFKADGSQPFAGDFLPEMTGANGPISVRSIGNEENKFKSVYADEVFVGASSLYVNGKKVIEDVADTITISTDVDQSLAFKTTGNGVLMLIPAGGIQCNISADQPTKHMNFTNLSNGGNITFYANGTNGQVQFDATKEITFNSVKLSIAGNTELSNNLQALSINTISNTGVGTSIFGTNSEKVLGIANGVSPTASPSDMVQLYSDDIGPGNAGLHVRTETGDIYKFGSSAYMPGNVYVTGELLVGNVSVATLHGVKTDADIAEALNIKHAQNTDSQLKYGEISITAEELSTLIVEFSKRTGSQALTADSGALEINLNNGYNIELTLEQSTTTLTFSNVPSSASGTLDVIQDISGNRNIIWPPTLQWPHGIILSLNPTPGARDIFSWKTDYSGNMYILLSGADMRIPS